MKKQIGVNDHVLGTLVDILIIVFDFLTDKISQYIRYKELEKRLK